MAVYFSLEMSPSDPFPFLLSYLALDIRFYKPILGERDMNLEFAAVTTSSWKQLVQTQHYHTSTYFTVWTELLAFSMCEFINHVESAEVLCLCEVMIIIDNNEQ